MSANLWNLAAQPGHGLTQPLLGRQHDGGADPPGGMTKSSSTVVLNQDWKSTAGGAPGRTIPIRAKKNRAIRWVVLSADGHRAALTADKRQLIATFNLDVPIRDLRLLDSPLMPAAGQPQQQQQQQGALGFIAAPDAAAQLLVRDNAMLLCMEHVRMIITAHQAILPADDEASEIVQRFMSGLQALIQHRLRYTNGNSSFTMGGTAGSGFATPTLQAHTGAPPHPAAVAGAINALANGPDFSQWHYNNTHHHSSTGGAGHNPPAKNQGHSQGQAQAPNLTRLTVPSRPNSNIGHADFHRHSTPPIGVPHLGAHSAGGGGLADGSSGAVMHGHQQLGAADMDGLPPRPVTPSLGDSHGDDEDGTLPFELAVLEAGLAEVCSHLAGEVGLLQAAVTPALEDLVASSNKSNLERVRRLKAAHQRLMNRAQRVHTALQRLMEDDQDLLRMCLSKAALRKATAAAAAAAAAAASATAAAQALQGTPPLTPAPSLAGRGGSEGLDPAHSGGMGPDASAAGAGRTPAVGSYSLDGALTDVPVMLHPTASLRPQSVLALKLRQLHHKAAVAAAAAAAEGGRLAAEAPAGGGSGGGPTLEDMIEEEDDMIHEAENLLEAYAAMAGTTQAALLSIGEDIDDTEDLVNINLDFSRNKLIRFEIVLTTGTFALAFYACFAGVLGENLVLPELITQDVMYFFLVNAALALMCILIFVVILGTLRAKRLL